MLLPVVYSGCSQSITKLQFGILSVLRPVTAAKCGRKLAKYWLWPFCQQVSAVEEKAAAEEEEEEDATEEVEEAAAENATFLNTTWRAKSTSKVATLTMRNQVKLLCLLAAKRQQEEQQGEMRE